MIDDPALAAWLVRVATPSRIQAIHSGKGGARVWRIQSGGDPLFLKSYRDSRRFAQELRAYQHWLPGSGLRAPELIAVEPALCALLISGIRGGPTSAIDPAKAHRLAGAWIHRFHSLPLAFEDPMSLDEALELRFESWLRRAESTTQVDQDTVRSARRSWDAGSGFGGMERVACHRDFEPRNWLIDKHQELWVIDFEHAGPDIGLIDMVRIWLTPAFGEFIVGYGSVPDDAALRRTAVLWGLATVVWAKEHQDPTFEFQGRLALERGAGRH